MLNLLHLRVLAAVARQGSVTGAAKELHYSQPSRLEAETGTNLIQRVGRGIRLTPGGGPTLALSGGGRPPRGPRPYDVICRPQTPAAPGSRRHSLGRHLEVEAE